MTHSLERPLPTAFRLEPDRHVEHNGRRCVVVRVISLGTVLVEDVETEERRTARLDDLRLWTGGAGIERRKIPDLKSLTPEKRAEGEKRLAVIQSLLGRPHRTRQDVKDAAEELGLKVSSLYGLIKRYRQEGSLTCLIPHAERGRKRKKRLAPDIETIIQTGIDEIHLTEQQERVQETIRWVNGKCDKANLKRPSPTTIRARIEERPESKVVAARKGPKTARDDFGYVLGPAFEPLWPLQRIQIDHTVADLFVVDPEHRQSVSRPVLTLAIDEFSRCVVGFCLRLAAPSTLSVALALTHAILPKGEYCRKLGLETPWDICGIPDVIFSDNAAEFDSTGLQLGCQQHGINGLFRPLGAPHFGGRIERLIGTMMGHVRLIPGATMSNIQERGADYDPEEHAAYTLEEAERRIATVITDIYHRTVHSAIGTTPLKLYEFGIFGDDRTPGRGLPRIPTDPRRLFIDFLPAEERSVQEYGIQINYVRYHAPILRAIHRDGGKKRHIVRWNPDDMSRIYLYNKENAEYYEIPYANSYRPPAALWEIDKAIAHLKMVGQDPKDEDAIFRTLERLRAEDAEKAATSKRARRNQERRREAARSQPPARPVEVMVKERADAAAEPQPVAEGDTAPKVRRIKPIADVEGW